MDNPSISVDNLGALWTEPGESSPDTRHALTPYANLHVMDIPDGAELLTTGEVMRLLHIARSTVTLWRREGKLRGYKPIGCKRYRWPSNQPVIAEALAALRVPVGPS